VFQENIDLEDVGLIPTTYHVRDARNWSFGDYFKKRSLVLGILDRVEIGQRSLVCFCFLRK
jgi:alanyl-tRNA synthetase